MDFAQGVHNNCKATMFANSRGTAVARYWRVYLVGAMCSESSRSVKNSSTQGQRESEREKKREKEDETDKWTDDIPS